MISLSILSLLIISAIGLAWTFLELLQSRRRTTPLARVRSILAVTIAYEALTVYGERGHRFTIRHWVDARELGTGWVPGALAVAQRDAAAMCKDHAWCHVSGLNSMATVYRGRRLETVS